MDRIALVVGALVGAAGLIGLSLSSSTASCGSGPAPTTTAPASSTGDGTTCPISLSESPFQPVPPPRREPPDSQLVVELELARAALTQAVDDQVPKSLGAATRKPIGTPGELTYRVTRGAPKLALDDGSLVVEIPIHAAVEICKPFGPICPTYGSCQPDLRVTAEVPLMLGADYARRPAEVDVAVTRGCRIAGIDVTDRVSQAAGGAVRTAERRIDEGVPPIPPRIEEARQRLGRPLRLGPSRCVKVLPRRVRQWEPHQTGEIFSGAFAVAGQVEPVACDATFDPPALPPLERGEGTPPRSEIRLAEVMPYDELSRRIAEAFASSRGDDPSPIIVEGLQAFAHRGAEGPQLALAIDLRGAVCGRAWVLGRPELTGDELRLARLELVSSDEAEALAPVLARLGRPIALPEPSGGATAGELAALTDRLAEALPIEGAGLTLDDPADHREVVASARGLALVTRTTGRLVVQVGERALD